MHDHDPPDCRNPAHPGCWVDLCQPIPQELAQAAEKVGFALPDRAAIGEIEFSSRVRRQGDVLFLNVPRFQDEDGPTAPLGFALTHHAGDLA